MNWPEDHPQREFLQQLNDGNEAAWKTLESEFMNYAEGKFLLFIAWETFTFFYEKVKDDNFRLTAPVMNYLSATTRIKQREYYRALKRIRELTQKLQLQVDGVGDTLDPMDVYSPREYSEYANKLKVLLAYFNIMNRWLNPKERARVELLLERVFTDCDWPEIAKKLGRPSGGAARGAYCTYRKLLQKNLLPLMENIHFDMVYKIHYKAGKVIPIIGVVIYDYNVKDIKDILRLIGGNVFQKVLWIGRCRQRKLTQLSHLVKEEFNWSRLTIDSNPLIKGEDTTLYLDLPAAIVAAKEMIKPYSIVFLDSTIYGRNGNVKEEKTKAEFEVFKELLFPKENEK